MARKFYLLLILPLFFITTNVVKADISPLDPNSNVVNVSEYSTQHITEQLYILENYSSEIDDIISYYESNYSSDYPYYWVDAWYTNSIPTIYLFYSSSPNSTIFSYNSNRWWKLVSSAFQRPNEYSSLTPYNLVISQNGVISDYTSGGYNGTGLLQAEIDTYKLALINHGINFAPISYRYSTGGNNWVDLYYDQLKFSSFESQSLGISWSEFSVYEGEEMPSIKALYEGTYSPDHVNTFTEINLNNYDYVILSLKDYTLRNLETNIYTLGQLCLTRVNDYGTSEAYNPALNDYSQGCTEIYTNLTPVRVYISSNNIENHAVWYVKAYDYNITNTIKVDPAVFDITYIDSTNSNDPTIEVGSQTIHVIPFDNLSSTANLSTSNGYVSGEVQNVFDAFNKQTFEDLISSPLKTLNSVWSSIISIFTIISVFISLLPPILQSFLILAFSIGIVLGILKIIL